MVQFMIRFGREGGFLNKQNEVFVSGACEYCGYRTFTSQHALAQLLTCTWLKGYIIIFIFLTG